MKKGLFTPLLMRFYERYELKRPYFLLTEGNGDTQAERVRREGQIQYGGYIDSRSDYEVCRAGPAHQTAICTRCGTGEAGEVSWGGGEQAEQWKF